MANFEIPRSLWEKLYDLTGDGKKNKGFFCFYIDSNGQFRHVISPMNDQVVLTALRKKAEVFLENMNAEEQMIFGISPED